MPNFGFKAETELQEVLQARAKQTVTRRAGESLFVAGHRAHGMYLVKSGKLRLWLQISEKKTIGRVVGRGSLVGLPATVTGQTYSLSCDVTEDAELAYLSRRDLTKLMREDTISGMKLLGLLSVEVQHMRGEIARPGLHAKAARAN